MATDFRSNLRKANRSAGGTRDRRGVFEDEGGGTSTTSSASSASRFSRDRDRTDSPSSRGASSITNKINKLSVNDDEEEEEKKEETSRRTAKGRTSGTAGLANKINKLSVNDDDEAGNESDEKEEEEEETTKKPIKKAGATSANAQKRKQRKHLRQKRRSTGVVIMPGQPVTPNDEEERIVAENTAKNMDEADAGAGGGVSEAQMEAAKQNEQYIEELKDELAKAHRELETLRNANLRLKDENSALLRVVGSLTGTGTGR